MEFDYANKGSAIPPPKDRMPQNNEYVNMDPSPDAHIIQDAPAAYNQQYDMPEGAYDQAVAEHEMQEQQQI